MHLCTPIHYSYPEDNFYAVTSRIRERSDFYHPGHSSLKSEPHPTKGEINLRKTRCRHASKLTIKRYLAMTEPTPQNLS